MNPREIIFEQIHHHETDPVPYTLAFEPEIAARLNEHYGGEDWRKRIVPYMERCGSVIASGGQQIEDTHYRDAFGTVWRTDALPMVVVDRGLKAPSFEGYDFPTIQTFQDPDLETQVKKRVAALPDAFTIISASLCLWESWYVRGFEDTLMDCIAEEDFYTELLDRMTALCLGWIERCADIPADAIMMGDDWGDQRGVLLGPERWRKFFKPRYARIFQAIHDQGKVAIMHCCGSSADIMGDIVDIGLDVIESVQPEAARMNPYELKRNWGDKITFWGCLGSQSTIPFGTPTELREEIRHLRSDMSKGGGYILAPAKPLRPETPTENAIALVEEFLDTSVPV